MEKNLDDMVLTPLGDTMRCGILTNDAGDVVILHDAAVNNAGWVCYDAGERLLHLVYEDGGQQDLGLEISDKMHGQLIKGEDVLLAYMQDGAVASQRKIALVVQSY